MAKKRKPKPELGGGTSQNHRRTQQSVLASPELAHEKLAPEGVPDTGKRSELREYFVGMMRMIPGLLTMVDGSAIDDAVDAVKMRRKLEKELKRNKVSMVDRDGKVAEAWKFLKILKDREHKLISELGLNPMNRKSVHVEKTNLRKDMARRGIEMDDNIIEMPKNTKSGLREIFGDDDEILEIISAFTGEEVA